MDPLNMIAGSGFIGLLIILLILIAVIGYFVPFRLWITAWASGAYVGLLTLVAMRLRRVPPHSIIKARISAVKAGLSIPLDELESHFWPVAMWSTWSMPLSRRTKRILS